MVEIVENKEGLLTSAEAARRLGIAVSTLKRWADEGRIEHVRTVGGQNNSGEPRKAPR